MPCNKIDNPLMVYRFSYVIMSIITLQYLTLFQAKNAVLSDFNVL